MNNLRRWTALAHCSVRRFFSCRKPENQEPENHTAAGPFDKIGRLASRTKPKTQSFSTAVPEHGNRSKRINVRNCRLLGFSIRGANVTDASWRHGRGGIQQFRSRCHSRGHRTCRRIGGSARLQHKKCVGASLPERSKPTVKVLFCKTSRAGSRLRIQRATKSRMAVAISAACVSNAKCPVLKKRTTASGMSRLNASAPCGRKNGSFSPHTARKGGL